MILQQIRKLIKKVSPIVIELFPIGRKIKISIVFTSQIYFKVTKTIRLNATHNFIKKIPNKRELSYPALCTSQQCRWYVSKEAPNGISLERRPDVSVVRLHDVLLECRDDVLRGRYDNVPSVCLYDVSNKSQMKHPTTSQWYVTKASQ